MFKAQSKSPPLQYLLLLPIALLAQRAHAETTVPRESLRPLVAQYCADCHSKDAKEGGLDLDALQSDLDHPSIFARWERIYDRVRTGEMPPQDAESMSETGRSEFLRILEEPLTASHAAVKGTVFRRLNRREYQNTMNDLFGTNLDLESRLPADGRTHEFDNVGKSLSISMVQLQQYLEAADAVMDASIAKSTSKPPSVVKNANYAETREGETHIGKSWKKLDDGAVVHFRSSGYPSGMLRTANVRTPGRYRIQVTAYAYQTDQPVTFAIGATTFQRGAEKPTFGYRAVAPGKPSTVEIDAWIENNYMVELTPWDIGDRDNEIRKNGVNDYKGPGLAILNVRLEGPLVDEFPSRGHRLIFEGLDRREIEPTNPATKKKSWYVPKFEISSSDPDVDVAKVLQRIATRAFRRPTTSDEIARYTQLYRDQRDEGEDFELALRTAVAAIFCSPDFLYLRESDGWLDDYAIAARLSYFLTRSTPDEPLLSAARDRRLSKDPQVLLEHAHRLLRSPHSQRFVADFTDAWLNLRDIDFTRPDNNLYPEFDSFLQYSMVQETRGFFDLLVRKNLGVRNLVVSDFAMLNNRLAAHYGVDGVSSPEVVRTKLPSESVRGGLLSQGAILKVSANGTNTSPVVRGVWVLERILGQAPPPPPPGIPGVEPDIRGASTLRELLDKHRSVDSCRTCHTMIDPPGFALESFDPIGGWRERFRSLGEGERSNATANGRKVRYKIGPPVDSSGQLADGKAFRGFREFRDLLVRDEDALARSLAVKLLTFATGREMGFSDRKTIEAIVERSKSKGHGVGGLIDLVVASEVFRRK